MRALLWGALEARRKGGTLEVVHAWSVPNAVYAPDADVNLGPFEEDAREVLEAAVAAAEREDIGTPVEGTLVNDSAVDALVRAAARAELLVIGSHGHGGVTGFLLGSVGRRCVELASCPVAVIPPDWNGDRGGRIVVGVDQSTPALAALRWALEEARERKVRLDVVHARTYRTSVLPYGALVSAEADAVAAAGHELLAHMLSGALGAAAPPEGVELITVGGGAARWLLEAAVGADLLVVGAHSHGTLHRLVFGSVSKQCLHRADCPVVVVPQRCAASVPRASEHR